MPQPTQSDSSNSACLVQMRHSYSYAPRTVATIGNSRSNNHDGLRRSLSEGIKAGGRHSAPQLQQYGVSSPIGAQDAEFYSLSSTAVRFVGVTSTNDHCAFQLHVDTGREQFVISKRFSEFRGLRQQLALSMQVRAHCNSGPCKQLDAVLLTAKFPRRTLSLSKSAKADVNLASKRIDLLQVFVNALLRVYRSSHRRQQRCCMNARCSTAEAIRRFFGIAPLSSDNSDNNNEQLPLAVSLRSSTVSFSDDDERKSSDSVTLSGPRRSASRDFPPPTRVSLETSHQFDQLYTITEDTELVHVRA